MRRGPALRWAATLVIWALAPLAGLAVLNLPTLLVMQTHDVSGAAPLGSIAAGLFVFAALWTAGVLATGRLHRGVGRRAHLTVCGVLALAGLAYPYLYGLIGYLTYRDA